MTVGEYVLVFVSLVLGLGVTDVLTSFHKLLRAGGRVRWSPLPVLAAVLVVLLSVMLWWAQFPQDQAQPVTIGEFLPRFGICVLVFLMAAAVLPDEVPAQGLDLGDWYLRNRAHFWSLAALTILVTLAAEGAGPVANYGVGGLVGFLRDRIVDVVVLVLFASLIVVRARWWHYLVLVVAYAGPVGWVSRSIG